MGLHSGSVAITRYKIDGDPIENPLNLVRNGLATHIIKEIDDEARLYSAGWTSLTDPFKPFFDDSSFSIGAYFVFALRIEKKTIPARIVRKYYLQELDRRLTESNREHFSRNEKKLIKENVIQNLSVRIPATPSVYELLWNTENGLLTFLSNQKAANEELETLFAKSFNLRLIRLFPYTMAEFNTNLTHDQRDALSTLTVTTFDH